MARCLLKLLLLIVVIVGAATGFLYSGIYDMGADVPHNRLTYWILETLRENAIDRASRDIPVPPLNDPDSLVAGGQDYDAMCVGCHLKPGKFGSDLNFGLYPRPPELSIPPYLHFAGRDPQRKAELARKQFWVIKHGIKASGMPAWGLTHDDERIWAMVAFLQELPGLSAEQYQVITAQRGTDAGHH